MATLEARLTGEAAPARHAAQPSAAADRWLQVIPHLDPAYGGLSAVVPRLAAQLTAQEGVQTRLAAFCSPGEDVPAQQQDMAGLTVWSLSRSAWMFDAALRGRFQAEVAAADGIHIHGLWESSTLLAAAAARKARKPYVLSAHGMLETWALANKRLKKALYAAAFERRNVTGAACLHALTEAEAQDYRRFGCKGPIAIIPNGVEAPVSADPALFLSAYPQAQGKRLILFLGRIHYKKGVDVLVNAWSKIAAQYPDALLVLAGPDSGDTLAKVTANVSQLGLQQRVLFTGMLNGSMKWSALAAASFFVLPSYSEGLSVAALEALSMGLPLILSDQCNLPQVAQAGAGWQVQTEVPPLSSALSTALSCGPATHRAFSIAAQALAEREFGWAGVTERMASVYRWVTGGPLPHNVTLLRGDA